MREEERPRRARRSATASAPLAEEEAMKKFAKASFVMSPLNRVRRGAAPPGRVGAGDAGATAMP